MRIICIFVLMLFISGKTDDSYNRTQVKIKVVEKKIIDINKRLDAITLNIDSLANLKLDK